MKFRNQLFLTFSIFFYFLISFKQYTFYAKDFGKIFKYVDFKKQDIYNQIQKQHPYWEVYKITQEARLRKKPVYTIFFNRNKKFLDETSTLFLRRLRPDFKKKKIEVYLTEPELYLNYFMYPRLSTKIRALDIVKKRLEKGSFILSDKNLLDLFPKTRHFLKMVPVRKKKEYTLLNRREEEYKFFIFYVSK